MSLTARIMEALQYAKLDAGPTALAKELTEHRRQFAASASGVSQQAVSKMLKAKKPSELLLLLASRCHVDPIWLGLGYGSKMAGKKTQHGVSDDAQRIAQLWDDLPPGMQDYMRNQVDIWQRFKKLDPKIAALFVTKPDPDRVSIHEPLMVEYDTKVRAKNGRRATDKEKG